MPRERSSQWLLNAATVLVTVAAIAVAVLRLKEAFRAPADGADDSPRTRRIANWKQFGQEGVRIGPSAARVTVVEFLDFQCPFCRGAAGDLRDLRRWFRDDLAVVYRQLPVPSHPFAYPAALAAVCAARRGAFEQLHDIFFEQQDSLGKKPWTRFAMEAGIRDTAEFVGCMKRSATAAVVQRDTAAAIALGARGTPTLLINDLAIDGSPGLTTLDHYVKDALRSSKHISQR